MRGGGGCRNKDVEAGGGVSGHTTSSSVTILFVVFYQAADTQAEWQRPG